MIEVEIDHREKLEGVRDQGPLQTCLAHATSSVHRRERGLDEPLSAESLHFHANGGDFDSGCYMCQIQRTLKNTGQPIDRHCDPIPPNGVEDWRPPSDARYYQSCSNTVPYMIEQIDESIRSKSFPVLGVYITDKFRNGVPPLVTSQGTVVGKHAVVGVGVGEVDGDTAILIRNSWGKGWGDSGHIWLESSFLDNHLSEVLLLEERDSE